jgi:hypothetical protein
MLGVMLWHYGSYFSFLFYLSFAGIVLAGKGWQGDSISVLLDGVEVQISHLAFFGNWGSLLVTDDWSGSCTFPILDTSQSGRSRSDSLLLPSCPSLIPEEYMALSQKDLGQSLNSLLASSDTTMAGRSRGGSSLFLLVVKSTPLCEFHCSGKKSPIITQQE